MPIEIAFKLFHDRNGMMNINNMIIAMKELKLDESEPIIYDIKGQRESYNKESSSYDDCR